MFLKRSHANSIRSLQSISDTLRHTPFIRKLSQSEGPRPTTCQWIHGEAKKRDFCGLPVKASSSYCETHHQICYVKKPLTQGDGT